MCYVWIGGGKLFFSHVTWYEKFGVFVTCVGDKHDRAYQVNNIVPSFLIYLDNNNVHYMNWKK